MINNRIFDVDAYSDGSGSDANDQAAQVAAINAALAAAPTTDNPSAGTVTVLYTRPFKVTAELPTINKPITIRGSVPNTKIAVRGTMRTVFNITSESVTVEDLIFNNELVTSDQVLNSTFAYGNQNARVTNGAASFVRVDKPFNGIGETNIHRVLGQQAPYLVFWNNGNYPLLSQLRTVFCGCAAWFNNGGLSGRVEYIDAQYGASVYIGRDTTRSGGAGSGNGPQGMEGTAFYSLRSGQGGAAAFKYPYAGIEVRSGLALKFFDPQPQQIATGVAFRIIGAPDQPIDNIDIYSFYGDTGDFAAAGTVGISAEGSVIGLRVYGGRVTNFDTGVQLNGASYDQEHIVLDGLFIVGSKTRDIIVNKSEGSLTNNQFRTPGGSSGPFFTNNAKYQGSGNFWAKAPESTDGAYVGALCSFINNRGPGSVPGLPTFNGGAAALNAGMVRGQFYRDSSVSPAQIKPVGF